MIAEPDWLLAGVTVIERFKPDPSRTKFWSGTRSGFEEFAVTVNEPPGTPVSETLKAIAPVVPFMGMVRFCRLLMLGALDEAVTVTTKLVLAVIAPSLTVSVRVVDPTCPAMGVKASVRLVPEPTTKREELSTREGFDEVADTVSAEGDVSASPTENTIGSRPAPATKERLATSLMVGGVFEEETVNTKLVLADDTPSVTVSVMVVVPTCEGVGVNTAVRIRSVPVREIPLRGRSVGFED